MTDTPTVSGRPPGKAWNMWPAWYQRFCIRAAVVLVVPVSILWHPLRGHHDEARIWGMVGRDCWRTGRTSNP